MNLDDYLLEIRISIDAFTAGYSLYTLSYSRIANEEENWQRKRGAGLNRCELRKYIPVEVSNYFFFLFLPTHASYTHTHLHIMFVYVYIYIYICVI